MEAYKTAYESLNVQQKRAVDQTEGPLLVLAGPGTGKTQLLTTRVAHILRTSDCEPQNILCLTFTESGAFEMRRRLINMIGQSAYNITISTYHGFGNEIIQSYPDQFSHLYDFNSADELTSHNLINNIIEGLTYDSNFKSADGYIRNIISTISELKRAKITPDDLIKIAEANLNFITLASDLTKTELITVKRISKKYIPIFEELLSKLETIDSKKIVKGSMSLQAQMIAELSKALDESDELSSTTPLSAWKRKWLAKNSRGESIVDGERTNKNLIEFADIYQTYIQALRKNRLYDYDDMILEVIGALQSHEDFKYTLQEKYMYVLLDEFQDTNAAQLQLISLLTDNPVYEGKPNIMAVGDDDQGIYAFQGADHSNMLSFITMYKETSVINLTSNYRSHSDIIHFAHGISEQIEQRLHHNLEGISKLLTAERKIDAVKTPVERHEFKTDIAQYAWTAKKINALIAEGIDPKEIAVIAPKHKYLEPLMPYLANLKIPVLYEKRENILDDTRIIELTQMARLILALNERDFETADSLWMEVLSYTFFELSTECIWDLSWKAFDQHQSISKILYSTDGEAKQITDFFYSVSRLCTNENLETMLDYLIGIKSLQLGDNKTYSNPFYKFYFGDITKKQPESYWTLLSNLTIIRQKLREHVRYNKTSFLLTDYVNFFNEHKNANIKILNTNPYQQATSSVQIMTAYKSKGLEFEHVFLIGCVDDVWGSSSKGQNNKVALPPNISHIRYKSSSDDEKLRLFYVASTRAKYKLYLTSYASDYNNALTTPLKYLNEHEEDGSVISPLVKESTKVSINDNEVPEINDLQTFWESRHLEKSTIASLKSLLKTRLDTYQMSPTHLNSYIDVVHGGPEQFFINTILRFPKAPTILGEFGDAVHKTLEWVGREINATKNMPKKAAIHATFMANLARKIINKDEAALIAERGIKAIDCYVDNNIDLLLNNEIHYEENFSRQGILVGNAHITGKIDQLIIDRKNRTITIVDYKTGKSYDKWYSSEVKLHKYKQQLYMYKLLVEGSYLYQDYKVTDAYLEFVEPNEHNETTQLHILFEEKEMLRTKKLIECVWQKIHKLEFPKTDEYAKNVKGIEQFEDRIIKNTRL